MRRFRATLAYDGTAYMGFQRQAGDTPTIQLRVEQAIASVTQQQVTVIGAGRTDRGVHAVGQVIAFDVQWNHDDAQLLRAINANLPDDIALQDLCQHEGFHPRFDALSRTYHYTVMVCEQRQPLMVNRAWQIRPPLESAVMQQAAGMLVGTHDFAAFGIPPQGMNTVREVYVSEWHHQPPQTYIYEVEATAFLYNMVRRIVGALVEVGRGRLTIDEFEQILLSRDLSRSKVLAPPQGLVLSRVTYPE